MPNGVQALAHASSRGQHVVHDERPFARANCEAALKRAATAVRGLRENAAHTEETRDLIADDDTACGWTRNKLGLERFRPLRYHPAKRFRLCWLLQEAKFFGVYWRVLARCQLEM